MQTVFINGKFIAQRMTGVQRLAAGLIKALDQLLLESGTTARWVLLCPPGATPPVLRVMEVRTVGPRRGGLHAWEQVFLPIHTAGQPLLNLAGPAPLLKLRQVCMIPDAAIFDFPKAYTRTYGAWYRTLFRTVSRTARSLLTISQFSRDRLIDAIGPTAKRLKIVDCAATHMAAVLPEDSILDRLGLRNVSFLLAVGSANPTKNLPALVNGFASVPNPEVRLVLVGGSNNAVFAEPSAHAPSDPRVINTGPISDNELAALYRHALAFAFPSLYEGFGIPPLEAMSLGCPVVAARAASIPEICADAALYFDPTSIPDITQALIKILSDPVLRDRLRGQGAIRARHFTWERAARQLLDHLTHDGIIRRDTVAASPAANR